jgi:hypothetical protein
MKYKGKFSRFFLPKMILKLSHVIHNLDLFARLERRQSNKRAGGAPEGVSKRAAVAGAGLPLYSKVYFIVQIVRLQF